MCGIAGILQTDGAAVDPDVLRRVNSAISHRGPDGEGYWIEGPVGLAHRRLSIIDLAGGTQPLGNEDGRVQVTFNGEIYNYRELRSRLEGLGHRFKTESDTEVIVHGWEQWGEACVTELRGMFAFAIWDRGQRQLFLARDRVGIKPLLYTVQPGWIAFASELHALRSIPGIPLTIDPEAIDLFLHYQYIPAPRSIYREVSKLPPGHTLLIDFAKPARLRPKRYWRLEFAPDRTLDEARWIERLDEALQETIAAHLVSDVPFGAFLSGGIDSSVVVAAMSRLLDRPVEAFCIGHEEASYDERRWAREAAEVTGANFHQQVVQPDGLALLPELVRHYGEPFADSSAIPTWYVSRLARQHVKMVLSGDGGDELFAGYHAYASLLSEHRTPGTALKRMKHRLANGARATGLWPGRPTLADDKYRRTAAIPPDDRASLWRSDYRRTLEATRNDFAERWRGRCGGENLNDLQAFDLENYIPFDNLTKVDIASMAHGLEVRVPLLDHRFMEVAAQVPPEMKLRPPGDDAALQLKHLASPRGVQGKYLLKAVAQKTFSHAFVHREKRGFEVPIRSWFQEDPSGALRDRLVGSEARLHAYFEASAVERLVDHAAVDKVCAWRAWSLLVFEQWLDEFA